MNLQTPYLKSVLAIARKDFRAEVRTRELVNAMLLFAVMSVLIFSFSLELDRQARETSVAGVLWVTIAYAGILGLGRSLAAEKDKGSFDAMLLSPIARSTIFYGKMLGSFVFTLVVAVAMMILLTVLFNVNVVDGWIFVIVVLGSLGFSATGTLVASISVHARAREMLLPILLLPVILPIILTATRSSVGVLTDLDTEDWIPEIMLLGLIDLIFVFAGYFLYDIIVEE
ncbi:MAG: heme exporter protein CcmB [Chloroflexi bacterium]|nr:heme exporter protein CcmB [Chloroflexota bacterium]